jgi:hypothetical protein
MLESRLGGTGCRRHPDLFVGCHADHRNKRLPDLDWNHLQDGEARIGAGLSEPLTKTATAAHGAARLLLGPL